MRAGSSGRASSTATDFRAFIGALFAAAVLFAFSGPSDALEVSVRDDKGRPVKDAVVYASAKGACLRREEEKPSSIRSIRSSSPA